MCRDDDTESAIPAKRFIFAGASIPPDLEQQFPAEPITGISAHRLSVIPVDFYIACNSLDLTAKNITLCGKLGKSFQVSMEFLLSLS